MPRSNAVTAVLLASSLAAQPAFSQIIARPSALGELKAWAGAAEVPAVADPHAGHAGGGDAPASGGGPADIVRAPSDLPGPVVRREAGKVTVELEAVELDGKLAAGQTYRYWTFNGQIPGPFVRVKVNDTVVVSMKNHPSSMLMHNVDFHAVTGPGGGAVATDVLPGQHKSFSFKALHPGIYVYHCAVPIVAQHISNGMYGLILVEPDGGLPPVDREFYVMQGELYTQTSPGEDGKVHPDLQRLLDERPTWFVFNGAGSALMDKPLTAKTGETVRIYFGVGGPNFTSSFHVIGEIFDRVYEMGSTSAVATGVQTVSVPPGGATIVDFKVEVPGSYTLVDHALSRLHKGLVGKLVVEGPERRDLFDPNPR